MCAGGREGHGELNDTFMKTRLHILTATILTALAAPLLAANSSLIRVPLTNTGVDGDARGGVLSTLSATNSEFIVQVTKLAPSAAYQIEVDGVIEGAFLTNSNGAGTVKFKAPNPGSGRALDFDPRGKVLRVLASSQSVLQATISAAGEPAGSLVVERANLRLVAATGATGKAVAEYQAAKDGRRVFKVELERAGAGPFALFVGGVKRGDFTSVGVLSKIKFTIGSDDAGTLPLDFDPRGQMIEVVRAGQVIFSSELAARALGVNVASPRSSSVAIPSTGADPDGHASANLRIDERARKHFSVEIEDVPAGTYTLLVDGANAGSIVVTATANGTKGEIEFTNSDDDSTELPLTFDPTNRTLTVKQGATTFFQGKFAPGASGGTGGTVTPFDVTLPLISTGADSNASAKAGLKRKVTGELNFEVEVEDVNAGPYELVVGGTVRGTLTVVADGNGTRGKVEFDTEPGAGKLPLNFVVAGQSIVIRQGSTVFFERTFPAQ